MANIVKWAEKCSPWEGGYQNDPSDPGNYTSTGILVGTNRGVSAGAYEKHFSKIPTAEDMKALTDEQWSVVTRAYWDAWRADEILNQSVADQLVEWYWGSGVWGIKIPQRLVGVDDDGSVGTHTLAAVNAENPETLHAKIVAARLTYIDDIISTHPDWEKYRIGWTNRIKSFVYEPAANDVAVETDERQREADSDFTTMSNG